MFILTVGGLHPDPVLNIYGSPIPVVEEAKFLGLLLDKNLTFIPDIKALKAKCLKALDILKVLPNTNWEGDVLFFFICIDHLLDQNFIFGQLYMVLHEKHT